MKNDFLFISSDGIRKISSTHPFRYAIGWGFYSPEQIMEIIKKHDGNIGAINIKIKLGGIDALSEEDLTILYDFMKEWIRNK